MKRTDTIIIGGGQAGLAMSRSLADRGIDHVVLERGRVAERWRSERWESLRMLTPRWQSRLPGWSYRGPDPDGFMTRNEVISYLVDYATAIGAPLHTGVTVEAVEREGALFRVRTDAGTWKAPNAVIATGHCAQPHVPPMAASLTSEVAQVVPTHYRNPAQLGRGGVLVVGASATGVQLASEIVRSGRPVTLAVGSHTRLPRTYRGRDILAWFDTLGVLSQTTHQVHDVGASRRQPSLQLVGSVDRRSIDLSVLLEEGVRIVGRMDDASDRQAYFAGDLAASIAHAQKKMHRQLDLVDRFIARSGQEREYPAEERPPLVHAPRAPRTVNLVSEGIGTVLWATGYRRTYPWLHVPVLDGRGELIHKGGITPQPGLYALGLNFMRRRKSAFIDGVGADAAELADHIVARMARHYVVAA